MAAVLTAKIRATIIWLQTPGAIPWRVSSQTKQITSLVKKQKSLVGLVCFTKKLYLCTIQ